MTVLVDHTRVLEVQVDLETAWIRMANHREIVADLRSAFRAAYAGARQAAGTRQATPPATAELAALVTDPEGLVAALWGARR